MLKNPDFSKEETVRVFSFFAEICYTVEASNAGEHPAQNMYDNNN